MFIRGSIATRTKKGAQVALCILPQIDAGFAISLIPFTGQTSAVTKSYLDFKTRGPQLRVPLAGLFLLKLPKAYSRAKVIRTQNT